MRRYHAPMAGKIPTTPLTAARQRLDKWLWAARFFKTRALAREAVEGGRVRYNGERAKPARELRVGDELEIRLGELIWRVVVRGLSEQRGPAPVARLLYEEDAASQAERLRLVELGRLATEPANTLRGRPTKKDRRMIHRFTE